MNRCVVICLQLSSLAQSAVLATPPTAAYLFNTRFGVQYRIGRKLEFLWLGSFTVRSTSSLYRRIYVEKCSSQDYPLSVASLRLCLPVRLYYSWSRIYPLLGWGTHILYHTAGVHNLTASGVLLSTMRERCVNSSVLRIHCNLRGFYPDCC